MGPKKLLGWLVQHEHFLSWAHLMRPMMAEETA